MITKQKKQKGRQLLVISIKAKRLPRRIQNDYRCSASDGPETSFLLPVILLLFPLAKGAQKSNLPSRTTSGVPPLYKTEIKSFDPTIISPVRQKINIFAPIVQF